VLLRVLRLTVYLVGYCLSILVYSLGALIQELSVGITVLENF